LRIAEERRALPYFYTRFRTEKALAALRQGGPSLIEGPVLIDGTYDNPNYWLRAGLLLGSVNPKSRDIVGILGEYNRSLIARSLKRLGAARIWDMPAIVEQHLPKGEALAAALLSATKDHKDVLGWNLPFGFPPSLLYDCLLKMQRTPSVDVHHKHFHIHLRHSLACLFAAEEIIERGNFSLVALSHAVTTMTAPLAWIAAQKGILTCVLFGTNGFNQFWKVEPDGGIFESYTRPTRQQLFAAPQDKKAVLAEAGRSYLSHRFQGRTSDSGNFFANIKRTTTVTKESICRDFGWSPDRPLIAIYSSNFFDYPHQCGMQNFTDFSDWLQETLAVARKTPHVNWLFKGHPCDELFYKDVSFSHVIGEINDTHIKIVPNDWNNTAMLDALDAVVTYHGTVGLEASAKGIPVLVADRGWYHDAGFVLWPRDRHAYLALLASEWWENVDLDAAKRAAELFAGWIYCCPAWQKGFLLDDDTRINLLYERLPSLLRKARQEIRLEIEEIAAWLNSGERFYHIFKMTRCDEIVPSVEAAS
jgi:hypothetical protein